MPAPSLSIAPILLLVPLLAAAQPGTAQPSAVQRPLPDVSLMVVSFGTAGLESAPPETAAEPAKAAAAAAVPISPMPPEIRRAAARPAPLVPLYISFAALQGLDAFTTVRGMNRGTVEANPLMGEVAAKPAALVAMKAGVTAATVLLTERLWKRNRVAAVAMMAALNGMYAAVVAHNWQVVR